MQDVVPLTEPVLASTEADPLGQITEKLLTLTGGNKEITWMAQPIEQAIYVNTNNEEQFKSLSAKLSGVVDDLNEALREASKLGQYHYNLEPSRFCIDIYYSRF